MTEPRSSIYKMCFVNDEPNGRPPYISRRTGDSNALDITMYREELRVWLMYRQTHARQARSFSFSSHNIFLGLDSEHLARQESGVHCQVRRSRPDEGVVRTTTKTFSIDEYFGALSMETALYNSRQLLQKELEGRNMIGEIRHHPGELY